MTKTMRKKLLALFCAGATLLFTNIQRDRSEAAQQPSPKYVFIFLADGAGTAQLEITRLYSRHIHQAGMTLTDKIMKEGHLGLITTHSADSLVTDSAAAGTALASGCKAKNKAISICQDGKVPKTVLEIARDKGMRIGLVTNAAIYDASPAAFAGHVSDRNEFGSLLDQYLKFEPSLLLGGGRDQFIPRGQRGSGRKDNNDIIGLFKQKGYTYISNKKELEETRATKLLGLFSLQDMSFELDRDKEIEPSLSDMTAATIRALEKDNRNGFAVFIEDENTDTAGHLSDVASVIHDFREFDRAVALAYEFYQQHPRETLMLVTSDHETGGLNFVGRASPEDLKKIQAIDISLSKAMEILGKNPAPDAVDRLLAEHFKGFVLPPEFKEAIVKKRAFPPLFPSNTAAGVLGAMVAGQTHLHWSTSGHTNQPVFVGALGAGAERFRGYQDNTDFARNLFGLLQTKNGKKQKSRKP